MKQHNVKKGECLSSISKRYGMMPETIWDHQANSSLRQLRKHPNVLMMGDTLVIPELRTLEVSSPTGQRHTFKRIGQTKIRIELLFEGEPLASKKFVLTIDGVFIRGTTDANGFLESNIPGSAKKGRVLVGEGLEQMEFTLEFGGLDPIDTITGLQTRLDNLGFYHGQIDGILDPKTKDAIIAFQSFYALPLTGQGDKTTLDKVMSLHGA